MSSHKSISLSEMEFLVEAISREIKKNKDAFRSSNGRTITSGPAIRNFIYINISEVLDRIYVSLGDNYDLVIDCPSVFRWKAFKRYKECRRKVEDIIELLKDNTVTMDAIIKNIPAAKDIVAEKELLEK